MERIALSETNIPSLKPPHHGKVRDVYDGDDQMLLVQTDRISAFDWKLKPGIPDKGRVLTAMTEFWFQRLSEVIPDLKHHLISTDYRMFDLSLDKYKEQLEGRSMVAKKVNIVPIEAIVRGYISGTCWKEYKKTGKFQDHDLPNGLQESEQFERPIFTPSTKDVNDVNITFERMAEIVGDRELCERIRSMSVKVYEEAAAIALEAGIIIADTKFEWGIDPNNGELTLADEVLTPDSSRFWPVAQYRVGGSTPSYDKQFVRDWLEKESGWDKDSGLPPPQLPEHIVRETRRLYIQAGKQLTGRDFAA